MLQSSFSNLQFSQLSGTTLKSMVSMQQFRTSSLIDKILQLQTKLYEVSMQNQILRKSRSSLQETLAEKKTITAQLFNNGGCENTQKNRRHRSQDLGHKTQEVTARQTNRGKGAAATQQRSKTPRQSLLASSNTFRALIRSTRNMTYTSSEASFRTQRNKEQGNEQSQTRLQKRSINRQVGIVKNVTSGKNIKKEDNIGEIYEQNEENKGQRVREDAEMEFKSVEYIWNNAGQQQRHLRVGKISKLKKKSYLQ